MSMGSASSPGALQLVSRVLCRLALATREPEQATPASSSEQMIVKKGKRVLPKVHMIPSILFPERAWMRAADVSVGCRFRGNTEVWFGFLTMGQFHAVAFRFPVSPFPIGGVLHSTP